MKNQAAPSHRSLSYKESGVDITAGEALVEKIKPLVKKTQRPGCLGSLGGFGGLFEIPVERYRQPVLVSGTDGVGTKLKLALALDKHDSIGIDLVAMCVNDILVQGAEPLYFLDYFACSKLDPERAARVIAGIARGCELAGAALIGGETAEMPGMYQPGEYDLAGFSVGIVEKSRIITGEKISAGDCLIGLASSGLHANGFSLVRKILEIRELDLQFTIGQGRLGEILLAPTRIYVKSLLRLIDKVEVKGMAHITGGGLPGNIVRILPPDCDAEVDTTSWKRAEIFDWLQDQGNIPDKELRKTLNCGIGMVVVVSPDQLQPALRELEQAGEEAIAIGKISNGTGEARVRFT